MSRLVPLLLALSSGLGLAFAASALGHSSGCHSAHSCPSDHHTYVWFDSSGQGWDCAAAGAPEYDPAQDTTPINYDGYTYYCHAAAATGAPTPSTTTTPAETTSTQTPVPDSDADGYPDANDPCPTTPGFEGSGCPLHGDPVPIQCHLRGPLPDRGCTPGATFRVHTSTVCRRGYAKRVRNVPESVKDQVYARYGIRSHSPATYEVDHLIPLELGGSNSIKNLFPEAAEPRPGFHEKDKLENRLHALVCRGKVKLRTAQRQIATNWVRVYTSAFRREP